MRNTPRVFERNTLSAWVHACSLQEASGPIKARRLVVVAAPLGAIQGGKRKKGAGIERFENERCVLPKDGWAYLLPTPTLVQTHCRLCSASLGSDTQAQRRWPSSRCSTCLTGAHSQPRTAWSSCPRWPTQYLAPVPGSGAPGPDPWNGQCRPGHHGQANARTGRHGPAQPAWASAAVRRW